MAFKLKILCLQATEEDILWAVNSTKDAAHAVKLLRLRQLLPPSFLEKFGRTELLSVLEMTHWDVGKATNFILDSDKKDRNRRDNFDSSNNNRTNSTSVYSNLNVNL